MKSFGSSLYRPRLGGGTIETELAAASRRPEKRLTRQIQGTSMSGHPGQEMLNLIRGRGSGPKMENEVMSIESVIIQSLDYACTSGWDTLKQAEFAARVVQRMRPEWSDDEAQSAVDWVRSCATGELRAF